MEIQISKNSKLTVLREVVSKKIEAEEVLLNLRSSQYFGLNETGSRLWAMLTKENLTIAEAARRLSEEFSVDLATAEQDGLDLAREAIAAEIAQAVL